MSENSRNIFEIPLEIPVGILPGVRPVISSKPDRGIFPTVSLCMSI